MISYRSILLLLLLGAILACLVWFGTLGPAPVQGNPPENDDVVSSYDHYVGDRVSVTGPVVSATPVTIRVAAQDGAAVELVTIGLNRDVRRGDVLTVYGTLGGDRQITVDGVVVKDGSAYTRTRVLSALAGLLVLIQGIRYWRPELSQAIIQRRETPIGLPWRSEDDA